MGRRPRESTEPRQAVSVRLKPETIKVFVERAAAKETPMASYIADYLDRAAQNHRQADANT